MANQRYYILDDFAYYSELAGFATMHVLAVVTLYACAPYADDKLTSSEKLTAASSTVIALLAHAGFSSRLDFASKYGLPGCAREGGATLAGLLAIVTWWTYAIAGAFFSAEGMTLSKLVRSTVWMFVWYWAFYVLEAKLAYCVRLARHIDSRSRARRAEISNGSQNATSR
ncbi:hypothetical protein Daesc_002426 [Daldinia eschscholtzii]|uniref:Transmembrane protein n=1 Tax=Daldinia eschscholtzii TaxID=292717 RepID=A0AAX6MY64_9PEZI